MRCQVEAGGSVTGGFSILRLIKHDSYFIVSSAAHTSIQFERLSFVGEPTQRIKSFCGGLFKRKSDIYMFQRGDESHLPKVLESDRWITSAGSHDASATSS